MTNNVAGFRKLENKEGLPWSVYVGAAGMPGPWIYISIYCQDVYEMRQAKPRGLHGKSMLLRRRCEPANIIFISLSYKTSRTT